MGISGDYYRAIVGMDQQGEVIKNTFYYLSGGTGPTATELATAVKDVLLQSIDNIQSAAISHVDVFVENLNDPQNDFATIPAPNVGVVAGEIMPKFVAWSYKLNVANRTTKAGGKRIGGVPESWVLNGTADPFNLTALNAVGDSLAGTLVAPGGNTYSPVVCRVTGTLATGYTILAANPIISATFNGVSTQNTRKR